MRICVFLGSQKGNRPEYVEAARAMGKYLASENIGLVYGGASIGLMGELARAATAAKGEVIGIIPNVITKIEIPASEITELIYVDTLEERETLMFNKSDAFIALPGGIGTLEEIYTVQSWNAMKFHDKTLGLLNISGYYNTFLQLLEHQCNEGFVSRKWIDNMIISNSVELLVDSLVAEYQR